MKKGLMAGAIVVWSLLTMAVVAAEDSTSIAQERGYPVSADIAPKATMVVNAENGQVLWAENSEASHDPASLTKMLVAYMVLEAIEQNRLSLDTLVTATETDQAISEIYALSNNRIIAGESYTVRELLSATMVASSNVATLMLSHALEGDDAAFLQQMTAKAQELGLTNTQLTNATGAEAVAFEGHYAPAGYDLAAPNSSTAKDMGMLAYRLLKRYPQILEFTSQQQTAVKAGTEYEQMLTTFNHSLPGDSAGLEGVDGLKTGSSPSAGYNTVVTAQRGDVRLIVVVLGASYWDDPNGELVRHYFANGLLEHHFANYHRQVVAPAGEHTVGDQQVQTKEDLYGLVREGVPTELAIVNNRLSIAGSMDADAGVALVEETASSTNKSLSFLPKKPIKMTLRDFWKAFPSLFVGLVVLVAGLRLFLKPNKQQFKQEPTEELG